jgi:vancomycin resistance protein VanJ
MPEIDPKPPRRSRWLRRSASFVVWAYCLLLALLGVWLWMEADRGWAATLLLFSPRWVLIIPGLLTFTLACVARHRWAIVLAIVACLGALGPLSGGRLNWSSEPAGRFRVVTFNCDGKLVHADRFRTWFQGLNADILLLQDGNRITAAELPNDWSLIRGAGGRAVASRYKLTLTGELPDPTLGEIRGAIRVQVESDIGEFSVVNLHLPTPRSGLEAAIHRDPQFVQLMQQGIELRSSSSAKLSKWIGAPTERAIVGGDFNLPPESTILRRDWSEWTDAFSVAGTGWGFTMHARLSSVRIDRVLFAAPWQCRSAWVGPELGSAHRPVVADLTLGGDP